MTLDLKRLRERFEAKVYKTESCWLWTASKSHGGYGRFKVGKRMAPAHRFSYEMIKGPIPSGLFLDHLCRVRACVNPDHLEVVTGRENTLRGFGPSGLNSRKTHCSKGHEFKEENIYWDSKGARNCRICRKEKAFRWSRKHTWKGKYKLRD